MDMSASTQSEERTRYLIEPEYKKSAYEEQIWNNTLKNGKPVSVKVGNVYRWGSFYIELTESEKEDLLKKDQVLLNDYEDFELLEMWDGGCDFWVNIVDEDDFAEEELEEINALLYSTEDDEDGGLGAYPQEEKMEINGWHEIDCEYTISSPYKLDKVVENSQ